jgi:phage replication-related protein YjqB (UPF0714/DUF867 family)
MKIIPLLAEAALNSSVGPELAFALQKAVTTQELVGGTGKEKHRAVFEFIKEAGYSIGKFMLNFGIKLAVIWLNNRADTKPVGG